VNHAGMVLIPAAAFRMGGADSEDYPQDGEGPVRTVTVSSFLIDATTVTNRRFAQFVRGTGYVTDAERYGWSYVFYAAVYPRAQHQVIDGTVSQAPWWLAVKGACWRAPEGPQSRSIPPCSTEAQVAQPRRDYESDPTPPDRNVVAVPA